MELGGYAGAGRERRGKLVTHTTRFAGVIFPLPDVPPHTRPAEACAPLFSLSTLLRSAAHRKTQVRGNEEPRRIAPHLFRLPLFTRARPPRRATPISARCAWGGRHPAAPASRVPVLVCAHCLPPFPVAHKNPSHPARHATLQRRLFFLFPHCELGCGDDASNDASSI